MYGNGVTVSIEAQRNQYNSSATQINTTPDVLLTIGESLLTSENDGTSSGYGLLAVSLNSDGNAGCYRVFSRHKLYSHMLESQIRSLA